VLVLQGSTETDQNCLCSPINCIKYVYISRLSVTNVHIFRSNNCFTFHAAPIKVYSGSEAILLDLSTYNSRSETNSTVYTVRSFYITIFNSQMSIQYVVGDVKEYLIRGLEPSTVYDLSVLVYENSAYRETIQLTTSSML